MKNMFHKTTWAAVRAGDTVLLPWLSIDRIVEVQVMTCALLDGRAAIVFEFGRCGYGRFFDLHETIYIQSRFLRGNHVPTQSPRVERGGARNHEEANPAGEKRREEGRSASTRAALGDEADRGE
jgi:hypothetical protein